MKHVTPTALRSIETPADFKRLIAKDASHIKQARGLVVIKNFIFKNGKKDTALFFTKKSNEAKEAFKALKTDYASNQLLVAQCQLVKAADGGRELQIKALDGGLSLEAMQQEAADLFDKLAILPKIGDFAISEEETSEPEPTPQKVSTATPTTDLQGSVGRGGDNRPEDVRLVQTLLNQRGAKLSVDGACGKLTIATIEALQQKIGLSKPDGRIDPNGKTWKALLGGNTPAPNPPAPNPQPIPPSTNALTASVGRGGSNQPDDVRLVQNLLNQRGAKLGVDGLCGNKTIAVIELLQQKIGISPTTGRIEPESETWKRLVGGGASIDTPPATPQPGSFSFSPGTIERPPTPADFVRMKDKEVTKELSQAAVYYLKRFTQTYAGVDKKPHYGEFIRFTTSTGLECLAHFEEHTVYGADLSKPRVPHPSIGLFRKK